MKCFYLMFSNFSKLFPCPFLYRAVYILNFVDQKFFTHFFKTVLPAFGVNINIGYFTKLFSSTEPAFFLKLV